MSVDLQMHVEEADEAGEAGEAGEETLLHGAERVKQGIVRNVSMGRPVLIASGEVLTGPRGVTIQVRRRVFVSVCV